VDCHKKIIVGYHEKGWGGETGKSGIGYDVLVKWVGVVWGGV